MTAPGYRLVADARLEELICRGTPASNETHDMAVELLAFRRAAAPQPEPPANLVESAKAFRREWMSDDAHLYSGEGTPDMMAAFAHEHAAELASAEIAANRDNVIEDAILDRDAAEAQAASEKARADKAEKLLAEIDDILDDHDAWTRDEKATIALIRAAAIRARKGGGDAVST